MTTETEIKNESATNVFESIRGTRDALSVRRVFGDPYEIGGITVIPVARVAGGAGGGGGEGTSKGEDGSGFGTGFGLGAVPVGVYEIRDGEISWQPAVDVNRIVKGAQVLLGIVAVCCTVIAFGRRPR